MSTWDIDFIAMSDEELLKKERELYEYMYNYGIKMGSTTSFGTAAGICTGGLSAIVSGPMLTYHTNWWYYYWTQYDLCAKEVAKRKLTLFEKNYKGMVISGAMTVGTAALCQLVPFADFAGEIIPEAMSEAITQTAEIMSENLSHVVISPEDIHTIAETIIGLVTREPLVDLVAIIDVTLGIGDSAVSWLHLGDIGNAVVKELHQNIPELMQTSTIFVGSVAVTIVLDSVVSVLLQQQAKEDMKAYLHTKELYTPAEIERMVEDLYALPTRYKTKYWKLSPKDLLAMETQLMQSAKSARASLCTASIEAAFSAVAFGGLAMLCDLFNIVVCGRMMMQLQSNLVECRMEIQKRKDLKSQFTTEEIETMSTGLLSDSIVLVTAVPLAEEGNNREFCNESVRKKVEVLQTTTTTQLHPRASGGWWFW